MQHRANKFLFLVLLLTIFSIAAQAQALDAILDTAASKYMQEKVYLHTDKSTYNSGETVWFKAYIQADNLPGAISKTLFAELINDKGMVLQRKMMPVILSGAASDFMLPDSTSETRLFIRAYTSWMLNFDSSLLYVKPIHIIPKKTILKKAIITPAYSISFFPEGGDLVLGLESHVAFKATDQDGTPVSVKGNIVNNKSKSITSFASIHDGMGVFMLAPQQGETYKALWKDPNGVEHESKLPDAKKEGVVLAVSFTDGHLTYSLARPDSVNADYTKYIVIAQMQQRLVYGAQVNLTKKTNATAPIATDSMPDGVMQLTVFNASNLPVAERLVFVNNNAYSFITDLHLAEKNITKRGRTVVQLDVGGKLLTNISVAVTDADINPAGKNEENIYSQFLLSSDLKGYVYNPAYYFSSDDDSVKQHLNLVMMTNGWRRFKWQNLLTNKWPVLNYLPKDYLSIEGNVIGLSRALLYNKAVTAFVQTKNNSRPSFFNIPINEQGGFFMGSMYFFDTAKLYYQLSNDKDKNLTTTASFSFKNNFLKGPAFEKSLLANLYLPDRTDSAVLLKSRSIAALQRSQQEGLAKIKTLDVVRVAARQKSVKEKLDEQYTSGFFSGGDGYTFATEEDPFAKSSPSVLSYLQGKVAGLQINTNGEGSASWRGSNTSFFLNESPSELNLVSSISMADVALIKVFRPPFFGASGGGSGGAIAIYTKKGSAANSSVTGLPFTNLYGYSVVRQFYSPDYINKPEPDIKDFRTTLYWNPIVYIDKNNRRITLPFFNSDNCKKIRVIVEGLNEAGLLTREEKIFE